MKSCPRCSKALSEAQVGNVKVDGCNGCGGVWFDNKELNAVAQTRTSQMSDLEDMFLPDESNLTHNTTMLCPVCVVQLYEFEFPHCPGIKLDACPLCRGIWVDDGELKAMHARMLSAQMAQSVSKPDAPTDPRLKARQVAGFLTSVPCPKCNRPNPRVSYACWACGSRLEAGEVTLCPNCDVPMHERSYFGVRVDICDSCTGVWMDNGELAILAKQPPAALQRIIEEAKPAHATSSALWDTTPEMLCPNCCIPMQEQQYAYSSGIRIDVCNQCNGVWVGGGKLTNISEYYNRTLGRDSVPSNAPSV